MYAQGVIDVHSHIITPEFLSSLKAEGRLMDEGFPLPEYDAEAHLKWMDQAGEILTQSLRRMKDYLTSEQDLAPYKEMILWRNAEKLFLKEQIIMSTDKKPTKGIYSPIKHETMIVRLAEIEVYPEHLQEYLKFANEVDRLSVEREPGVLCLFPMQSAEDSTQIRILEIYASEEAYQSHIKTEHFQKYKQGTLHMVKSLKLPTMQPLDPETMKLIFLKSRPSSAVGMYAGALGARQVVDAPPAHLQ